AQPHRLRRSRRAGAEASSRALVVAAAVRGDDRRASTPEFHSFLPWELIMRCVSLASWYMLGLTVCAIFAQDAPRAKPAADLPAIKELPNPFQFADGSPVRTAKDWERRRGEIKGLFEDYMYGHMPPKPQKMTVKKG